MMWTMSEPPPRWVCGLCGSTITSVRYVRLGWHDYPEEPLPANFHCQGNYLCRGCDDSKGEGWHEGIEPTVWGSMRNLGPYLDLEDLIEPAKSKPSKEKVDWSRDGF